MPISWNEIRHDAIRFSRDWTGAKSESAEKQTFWNEFFQVFGVSRRAVASFKEPVKRISGEYGYIDLFGRESYWLNTNLPVKIWVKPNRKRSVTFKIWRVKVGIGKFPVMSSFPILHALRCTTLNQKIKSDCQIDTQRQKRRDTA